jgi:hypothetical protein
MSSTAIAQQAESLRPPAYPLISIDPYTSVWAMQDSLSGAPTRHWTDQPHSLRGIIRVDGEPISFLGEEIPTHRTYLPLVGSDGLWNVSFEKPSNGWQRQGFDDSSWETVTGSLGTFESAVNEWSEGSVWVRRNFTIEDINSLDLQNLKLNMFHDDNVKVYINGVLAFQTEGWVSEPQVFDLADEAIAALQEGKNVLAIRGDNTAGGAYLDAGLVEQIPSEVSLSKAKQISAEVEATQTTYTFEAGPVALTTTFTAPLLMDNLDLTSRPVNYVTFDVESTDSQSHEVEIFFSTGANMAVNSTDQKVAWQHMPSRTLDIMRVGTANQQVLGRKGDGVRIDWGYLYLAAPKDKNNTTGIASSKNLVTQFAKNGQLNGTNNGTMPQSVRSTQLSSAIAYDLGSIDENTTSRHALVGYDDIYSVEYFGTPLQAWWKKDGASVISMLEGAEKEYGSLWQEAQKFDDQLFEDAKEAGGFKYAELTELAYRQSISAHKLVAAPDGDALFFSKENFSNGSIGTVDVTYPSAPLFLYYNPELLKGMLRPIFYYTESGRWTKPFPAHDVGTYPIANGQTYGEDMPVEEAGNMLILTTAIAVVEDNPAFAEEHWKALTTWANYLLENGLDPKNQLSTDDFSGHLARNANLSIKAILGVAGYGRLARMVGKDALAEKFTSRAKEMGQQWMDMADAGNHYMLAFGKPNTWSQKYNLAWDDILNLNIFPDEINRTEVAYYLDQQNEFGLPLDNRASYTKSDWIMWTATLTEDRETFLKFIEPMYKAFNTTSDRVPMTDWYETDDASQVGFQARSVVGGYFLPMLEEKLKNN